MGRRSEVLKMPIALRCELDDRLRAAGYGDYEALETWLRSRGQTASKSALHRYGTALQKVDASAGNKDAQVARTQKAIGSAANAMRDGLLLELGRLRYRESLILKQIEELDSGISH